MPQTIFIKNTQHDKNLVMVIKHGFLKPPNFEIHIHHKTKR